MSKLIWNEKNLPTLGLIYLRTMRDNMREETSTVRLGTTGKGIAPHYEITLASGVHKRNGLNHCLFKDNDKFDSSNLSEPFSYAQITKAYCACRDR
ncbi:hypothetical protein HMPREF1487_09581 [Pseudomonas sp. HPB0071]|nr:hypothetical protein HMPREF1487_09581 [Pseudomonas sp. HPB0071]SHJ67796.1 hypothetical protein SAMN05216295_12210 [Pseudomonas zeshuii]